MFNVYENIDGKGRNLPCHFLFRKKKIEWAQGKILDEKVFSTLQKILKPLEEWEEGRIPSRLF